MSLAPRQLVASLEQYGTVKFHVLKRVGGGGANLNVQQGSCEDADGPKQTT